MERLDTSSTTVREISQVRKRSTNIVSSVEKRDILNEIACRKAVVSQGKIYETTKILNNRLHLDIYNFLGSSGIENSNSACLVV